MFLFLLYFSYLRYCSHVHWFLDRQMSGRTMHKAYQPTLPAANRLLQKKWDDKYYAEHRLLVIPSSFLSDHRTILSLSRFAMLGQASILDHHAPTCICI